MLFWQIQNLWIRSPSWPACTVAFTSADTHDPILYSSVPCVLCRWQRKSCEHVYTQVSAHRESRRRVLSEEKIVGEKRFWKNCGKKRFWMPPSAVVEGWEGAGQSMTSAVLLQYFSLLSFVAGISHSISHSISHFSFVAGLKLHLLVTVQYCILSLEENFTTYNEPRDFSSHSCLVHRGRPYIK